MIIIFRDINLNVFFEFLNIRKKWLKNIFVKLFLYYYNLFCNVFYFYWKNEVLSKMIVNKFINKKGWMLYMFIGWFVCSKI